MYNFYLKEASFKRCSVKTIENNFQELNLSMSGLSDTNSYLCSEKLWKVKSKNGQELLHVLLYELEDKQFMNQVIPYIFHRITKTKYIKNYKEFKLCFPNDFNAFWGVFFYGRQDYEVRSNKELNVFKYNATKKVLNSKNFKSYNDFLFPNLIVCPDVYNEIMNLKNKYLFSQFITQLEELNKFAEKWLIGNFELKKLNDETSLTASGESDTVNGEPKLRSFRYFKLPNGKNKYFEKHIKTGDLRIYFLEDNVNHKFYIGYVGKHLPTAKHK